MLDLFFKYKKTALVFGLLILAYLAQTLFAPIDEAALRRYHLQADQARALGLTVALPYIIIWIIALIGYLRLRSYADTIKGSRDGAAFDIIAKGILLFVFWLPLSTIIGGLFTEYYNVHHSSTASLVRINNYFNFLILFPAFWLVKRGSQRLLAIIKKPIDIVPQFVMIGYIAVSALYVLLVLHDAARLAPANGASVASYYEPDWLLVTTIIIPRLIAWFWGFQAVTNIMLYRSNVKGKLYKQALNNLAKGLAGLLVTTILLRCLQSLTTLLNRWSLAGILSVIYLLLIIMSIGYAYIAVGAKNLQKLEEL